MIAREVLAERLDDAVADLLDGSHREWAGIGHE